MRAFPGRWSTAARTVVGFLSPLVGSAGPLGAAVFLSLRPPKTAYAACEPVTATLMPASKGGVDGRAALLGPALGASMVLNSWTGRKLIVRMPDRWCGLLTVVALSLVA